MRLKILFTVYFLFTAICCQIKITNTRSSTLWRLENGKITSEEKLPEPCFSKTKTMKMSNSQIAAEIDPIMDIYTKDHTFYIIATMNEVGSGGTDYGGWTRQYTDNLFDTATPEVQMQKSNNKTLNEINKKEKTMLKAAATVTRLMENTILTTADERLDCGKPVNYTKYDHLFGIGQRHYYHPVIPEPEVAYLFLGTNDEYAYRNFDLAALERKLMLAKYEQQRLTFDLLIDIGNYFRIIGDTRQAIECFRHAITLRDHPDALLNLARILYNLEYFSDAILLSFDSINAAPKGYIPWQEYFMLGEIFKASGSIRESSFHLRRALELHPHHEPILKVLRDVENTVLSALHIYTLIIIIALVVAVFVVIITNIGSDICSNPNVTSTFCITQFDGDSRTQVTISKHSIQFNRALAMRSLRGFPSNARYRHRRY